MKTRWVSFLFLLSGIYDAGLGLGFLFFWPELFSRFAVTPPNHAGYIQFPAILLVIFGVMFLQIARDPYRNRNMMLYGAALKAAYCGVVFWYERNGGIPDLWIPWAWADLLFLIGFVAGWLKTSDGTRRDR